MVWYGMVWYGMVWYQLNYQAKASLKVDNSKFVQMTVDNKYQREGGGEGGGGGVAYTQTIPGYRLSIFHLSQDRSKKNRAALAQMYAHPFSDYEK